MKQTISMLFGRSKIALAVLTVFLFGFFAGIFFSFPEMNLKRQIISSIETQGHVAVDQGVINIGLLGIEGSDLLIRPENPLWPTIPINSLHIAPQWLSLFSKDPGVHLDMQLFGGTLWADVFKDGRLSVEASQIDLGFLLPKDQQMKISGLLAKMKLASTVPLAKTSESLLAVALKGVKIAGQSGMNLSLNLGDIDISGIGRGRSIKIVSLNADKGDLSISGKGSVLLGHDLPSTQVNMKIEIRPENTADPMLVELLKLGTRHISNGSYELTLSGPLSELLFRTF